MRTALTAAAVLLLGPAVAVALLDWLAPDVVPAGWAAVAQGVLLTAVPLLLLGVVVLVRHPRR